MVKQRNLLFVGKYLAKVAEKFQGRCLWRALAAGQQIIEKATPTLTKNTIEREDWEVMIVLEL